MGVTLKGRRDPNVSVSAPISTEWHLLQSMYHLSIDIFRLTLELLRGTSFVPLRPGQIAIIYSPAFFEGSFWVRGTPVVILIVSLPNRSHPHRDVARARLRYRRVCRRKILLFSVIFSCDAIIAHWKSIDLPHPSVVIRMLGILPLTIMSANCVHNTPSPSYLNSLVDPNTPMEILRHAKAAEFVELLLSRLDHASHSSMLTLESIFISLGAILISRSRIEQPIFAKAI